MKKILIATSALVAFSATSAFALDVTTSGSVEYRYTKDKAGNTAQNAKLSQKGASVKFAASGASNGLAYGAYVTFKSNGAKARATAVAGGFKKSDSAETTDTNKFNGWTQSGRAVFYASVAGASNAGKMFTDTAGSGHVSATPANNATTESALWVSGAWGKVVAGQSGNAAGLAPSGAVSAAAFATGDEVAASSAGQKSSERVTYTAPTFVEGLSIAYTHSFKGNTSTDKTKNVKAPSNWGIQYATSLMGVGIKAGYAEGKTEISGSRQVSTAFTGGQAVDGTTVIAGNATATATKKARKNTAMGVELSYGNFTVGYGAFTNEKKYYQTKDTGGSAYGVKYNGGAWAVGYTVKKSEDTNKYVGTYNKSASTNAISASYTVAEGFSVYASRSTNKVKKSNNTTAKKNFTIIGAKIAF